MTLEIVAFEPRAIVLAPSVQRSTPPAPARSSYKDMTPRTRSDRPGSPCHAPSPSKGQLICDTALPNS